MTTPEKKAAPLGFGLMRLPMKGSEVDIETTAKMTDLFLKRGFTYFDTAYFYLDERSEKTVKSVLTSRHSRSAYTLATKMPIYAVNSHEDLDRFFANQLERTGAGYFDYYLLHAVNGGTYEDKVKKYGIWDFIKKKKREGLVRHIGFSFHDTPEVLEKILSDPLMEGVEFVQLQINYLDWDSPKVRARECYETARRHGKKVVVMEPVRGGSLAVLPPEIRAALPGDSSPAAEALSFAASLEGVIAVLSGMSNEAQMEENTALFSSLSPMPESERQALLALGEKIRAIPTIPCTRCKYCLEVCPKKLPIPRIIQAVNDYRTYHLNHYRDAVRDGVKASDCIACGLCAKNCPQKIEIPAAMKEAAKDFEA